MSAPFVAVHWQEMDMVAFSSTEDRDLFCSRNKGYVGFNPPTNPPLLRNYAVTFRITEEEKFKSRVTSKIELRRETKLNTFYSGNPGCWVYYTEAWDEDDAIKIAQAALIALVQKGPVRE